MLRNHDNPLLAGAGLPAFSRIRPEHVEPAVDDVLRDGRQIVQSVLHSNRQPSWHSIAEPLEEIDNRLNLAWSPVGHLHAVADTPELRDAYNACLPKLTEYATEIGQNVALFEAYQAIAQSPEFGTLSEERRRSVDNALRDFRLAGVNLTDQHKQRYKTIATELAALSSKFGENVLDATQGWRKLINDPAELQGLPASAMALTRETAEREEQQGWMLTLEFPCYFPVITYADNRQLRREVYEASTTRASDQGPNPGAWDNSGIMTRIIELRQEKARLLGFANYAEYSLSTKMAKDPTQVMDFLQDLARRARPIAEREYQQLQAYARDHHQQLDLQAWDLPYYAEKLRQHKFCVSQEELRPYFPLPRVLSGMFEVVHRLYGLSISKRSGVDSWHNDVQFYDVLDSGGELCGQFYLDLYARPHKRGGAWMDECVIRRRAGGQLQIPVAFLTCNFTPPVAGQPAQLTHDEVTTLFHEFGHGLHHMLTRVDTASVSGINGVAWDAVELPSQFMENWCWQTEAILLISGHVDSGESLPTEMLQRMIAAKNFQAGLRMLRQLEFALFDFRLHMEYEANNDSGIQSLLEQVRQDVAVIHPPAFNRFAHAFTHVFGGGYAAGYYSYLWAEVLSSDAFSIFEENGIFHRASGEAFLHTILERGGSRDAMDLFVEFRGREPDIAPLLRHSGLDNEAQHETV